MSERVDPAGTGRAPDRLRLARVVIGNLARPVVRTLLRGTRHGVLTIIEGGRSRPFGTAAAGAPSPVVMVHDSRFYSGLLRGSLGVSEAYSEGWFDCSDLAELARLAALNMPALDRWRRGVRRSSPVPSRCSAGARGTRPSAHAGGSPRTTTSATTSSV